MTPSGIDETDVGAVWCSICQEDCMDHPKVCTICGAELQVRPTASSTTTNNDAHINGAWLERAASMSAMGGGGGMEEVWQEAPTEAMDPQAVGAKSHATSKACLEMIPRIPIVQGSSLLHEGMVTIIDSQKKAFCGSACVAEFGPKPPYSITGSIVLADPLVGKPVILEKKKTDSHERPVIVYVERGGSITFATKALWAQEELGASAVICGNNVNVWPYTMRDSKRESGPLRIPILMVNQTDASQIKAVCHRSGGGGDNGDDHVVSCSLSAAKLDSNQNANSCAVCCASFQVGDIVMRLPFCAHTFHETCALTWLTKHNTCPYCRWELPTDDEDYDRERRRRQASSTSNSGSDDHRRDWEILLFG
uniref:RING-type domain-containing protein n=1 Tax=Attheya septentrionalis TaxID=420275 RepID=A0A7S2UQA7_9STRA|mmetsp:Transcript_5531/g.9746  ORF Transcript_5531/g.9746 Transcript_5531/m.9746 type:complete len:365 (+) Transcript_5531:92-1186(+)|eukprot:CAMPEP_0198291920 /NCGR_PEP_ID=MMETSP1449-20131203/9261_1 /TAXON_ID=420275 /ORGANISM="Attheya septentrionalis, Strain CCMP2084" /LENGTH=364 /DNA_ID=CAMNT_0043990605 /DNA_START=60 /DNA_END=1154 /DNA_ORIENTATION=-